MSTDELVRTEVIAPEPAEALAGLLDIEAPDRVPELWHWIYLLERRPHADLGPEGHPSFGIPSPPGPGRRRMFAGGRVVHHDRLRFAVPATKTTRVTGDVVKDGSKGPLNFVTVRHEISQDDRAVVVDEQDIVYLTPTPSEPIPARDRDRPPAPTDREPVLDLRVDEALLFRFSALTYNAHRIHYDPYWARHEGYEALVVHGPLQALMMGELVRRHGPGLLGREFAYRLVSPMVGPQTLRAVPAADGIEAGAEVLDVGGTVTARASIAPSS